MPSRTPPATVDRGATAARREGAAPRHATAAEDPRAFATGAAAGREQVPPRRRSVGSVRARRAGAADEAAGDVIAGVRITHPERVLYPEAAVTKRDIARYYARMAPHILPYIRNRPLSLLRCPQGPTSPCFFQKHATEREIPGITFVPITESGGEKPYVIANTARALAGLAQMGTLELHGWNAVSDDVERADMMVFDFDPDPSVPFAAVVGAALQCRAVLGGLGLESFAKTTGGKGLHVVVPLSRRVPWAVVKRFAKGVAEYLVARHPDRFTAKAAKAARRQRIFVDYLRNARGATAVVPYSLRARTGATVAVPLDWNEVKEDLQPAAFDLRRAEARVAHGGDPWTGYRTLRQTITAEMQRQLDRAS